MEKKMSNEDKMTEMIVDMQAKAEKVSINELARRRMLKTSATLAERAEARHLHSLDVLNLAKAATILYRAANGA